MRKRNNKSDFKMKKWPNISLLLLACALLIFPFLASLDIIPSPKGHENLIAEKTGDRWCVKIFVAFANEKIGGQEIEMGQSVYFVPSALKIFTISTIYRNGMLEEPKIISSSFSALIFVGLVIFAAVMIVRFIYKTFEANRQKSPSST